MNELKAQLREQLYLLYEIMKEPEYADTVATSLWNLFIALKEKGFGTGDAMAIVQTMAASIGRSK